IEGPGGARISLGEGLARGTRSVELGAAVPEAVPRGPWTLALEVRRGEEVEHVRVPIEVGDAATVAPERWLALRNACEEGSHRVEDRWEPSPLCLEPPEVRIYPESGALVANLDNPVLVYHPSARTLTLQALPPPPAPGAAAPPPRQPPAALVPDRLGLAPFRYTPTYPRGPFRIVVDGHEEEQWIRDVPGQVLIEVERALLGPGETVRATVTSLRRRGPLYLDVWAAGRWIGADSVALEGSSRFEYEVRLPEAAHGVVALRAYTQPDGPIGAYDERLLWVTGAAPAEALAEVTGALAGLPLAEPLAEYETPPGPDPLVAALAGVPPEQVTPRALEHAVRALLSRVEITVPPSPRLADTASAKLEAMRQYQTRLQRPILTALAALGVAVLVAVLFLLVRLARQTRRRLAEVELDSELEDAEARPIRGSGILLEGALLVGILVAAIIGLLVLLQSLRWTYAL
ncbi:MAG: hypothetical protein D6729_04540, partial [Deltaproteobacteria bacterium]